VNDPLFQALTQSRWGDALSLGKIETLEELVDGAALLDYIP